MPAPFRLRLPLAEMARLGPQIQGAVKQYAPENASLVEVSADLAKTGGKIGSASRPRGVSVVGADEARDELVRALALGIQYTLHRVDLPDQRAAALRLQAALLGDGYAWVDAPLGVESARIAKLMTDAARPEVAADLATAGLADCVAALARYQDAYLDVERGRGAAAGASLEVTKEQRKLVATFNRKLDLYVAQVEDKYAAEDGADAVRRTALLQPIVAATGRDRAQDQPPGGGGGGTTGPGAPPGGPTTPPTSP